MKIKLLFIIALTCNLSYASLVSECYHYHTSKINEIKINNGLPYWVQTVLDPNGLSIVSRTNILLEGLQIENLKYVSENDEVILLANLNAYYWIHKNQYIYDKLGPIKIVNYEDITDTFGASTFCVNGRWKHLTYNTKEKKIKSEKLERFPSNALIIGDFGRGKYLIKGSNEVFVYEPEMGVLERIPNLDDSTNFVKANWTHDDHFLYDNNTFYLLDINFEERRDITQTFKYLGLKEQFTKADFIVDDWRKVLLDFNDGNLWLYDKSTQSGPDGSTIYFTLLENAKRLSLKSNYMVYKDKIYNLGYHLKQNRTPVSMKNVELPMQLEPKEYNLYSDSKSMYYYKYKDDVETFYKISNLPIDYRFYKGTSSYRYALSSFMADKKTIFYWDENKNKIARKIKYNSPIKNLKLAYAFDNKLLIEDKIITNIANVESIEYVGSTVDVITPCDGGRGQYPVVVEYNYYFKDKDSVYSYHSGDKKLETLKYINAEGFTETNFYDRTKKNKS